MDANRSGKAHASDKTEGELLAFGRADYLGTKAILALAAAGAVLFGLGGPLFEAATKASLAVSYPTKVTGGIELPRGATHNGEATLDVLLTDPTFVERCVQTLPGFFAAGLTVAVAWLLFQLLRSTQAGEPFTRRNVRRINTIALLVGIGGTMVQVVQGFADNAIWATGRLSNRDDMTFVMAFTALPLVLMLVLGLIAEAFRRGVELRDDVEGLV